MTSDECEVGGKCIETKPTKRGEHDPVRPRPLRPPSCNPGLNPRQLRLVRRQALDRSQTEIYALALPILRGELLATGHGIHPRHHQATPIDIRARVPAAMIRAEFVCRW